MARSVDTTPLERNPSDITGRVWYALLHPPSRDLDVARAEINRDIWKIQKKVLGFMAKKITELEKGMEQEREENARYRDHSNAEEEKKALTEVRHLLGIDSQEAENAALNLYEDLINYMQRQTKPKHDLLKILRGTRYDEWKDRRKATILILHAEHAFLENSRCFWLSLAALHARKTLGERAKTVEPTSVETSKIQPAGEASECRAQNEQTRSPIILHYFFCSHDDALNGRDAYMLISNLIAQLLVAVPELATDADRREHLSRLTGRDDWRDREPVQPCKFLAELIRAVPETEIYIILDRIDFCTCEVRCLVGRLEKMLGEVDKSVKILAVLGPLRSLDELASETVFLDSVAPIERRLESESSYS